MDNCLYFLFQLSTSVPHLHVDLIKFVKIWSAITSVNVLQESLKRKTATFVKVST